LLLASTAGLVACGGVDERTSGAPSNGEPKRCPAGSLPDPSGACIPVGIQGCVDRFLSSDGLCRPAVDACPRGTIPKHDEGCVPVGIAGCAAMFVDPGGHCRPARDKCPAGTFPLPTEGCVPLDGPAGCGTGTWGAIADGPNTIWVDPSYAGGDGDGSKQKPLTTIAAALTSVPSGGRIALAAGKYDESAIITKPLEIVGRCPSMVSIVRPTPTGLAIVEVRKAEQVILRSLRITGPAYGVDVLTTKVAMHHVHVAASRVYGVYAHHKAEVSLDHCLIEDTKSEAGSAGLGLYAYGATATITASALIGNRDVSLLVEGSNSSVKVERSLISDTQPQGSQQGGSGIWAKLGATVSLLDSAVLASHESGILVFDGAKLGLERSEIAGTKPQKATNEEGIGIGVDGSVAKIIASSIVDNHHFGLVASSAPASVYLERTLIADTKPQASDGQFGDGVFAYKGVQATIVASAIARNHRLGLGFTHADAKGDTQAIVSGSVIVDTAPLSDGSFGVGAFSGIGAKLELKASFVSGSHTAGVLVLGGRLDMNGSLVERTSAGKIVVVGRTYDGLADGLAVGFQATADARQTAIRDAQRAGVVFDSSSGTLGGVNVGGGRFGMVAQGKPKPSWSDSSNVFAGSEQSILTDGLLPVPVPPPLPD
jgi:hypothetical protein